MGLGLVIAVGAASAAGLLHQGTDQAAEASLDSRVRAFWEARVAGDLAKAYALESASHTGEVDLVGYARNRNPAFKYNSYEIQSIAEDADTATVELAISYTMPFPHVGEVQSATRMRDKWVRLDGVWYRKTRVKPIPAGDMFAHEPGQS